jgi:hypothetical protein
MINPSFRTPAMLLLAGAIASTPALAWVRVGALKGRGISWPVTVSGPDKGLRLSGSDGVPFQTSRTGTILNLGDKPWTVLATDEIVDQNETFTLSFRLPDRSARTAVMQLYREQNGRAAMEIIRWEPQASTAGAGAGAAPAGSAAAPALGGLDAPIRYAWERDTLFFQETRDSARAASRLATAETKESGSSAAGRLDPGAESAGGGQASSATAAASHDRPLRGDDQPAAVPPLTGPGSGAATASTAGTPAAGAGAGSAITLRPKADPVGDPQPTSRPGSAVGTVETKTSTLPRHASGPGAGAGSGESKLSVERIPGARPGAGIPVAEPDEAERWLDECIRLAKARRARPGAGAEGGESKLSVGPKPAARPDSVPGRVGIRAVESKVTQGGQGAVRMEDASEAGAAERLAVACDKLAGTVARMRRENPKEPIHLMLGAPATEWERFAPGHWIFLNARQQPHQPYPGLCGDYNNLEHLTLVAGALAGQVDHIYFDHQAMQSLAWNADHLERIRFMLLPDSGVFHFPLDQCGLGQPVRHAYQPDSEPTPEGIVASSSVAGPKGGLPVDFLLPFNIAKFDKALQMQAVHQCQEKLLHPAIYDMLGRTFDQVVPEEDLPKFLRLFPGRPAVQESYLACRTVSKFR